VNFGVSLSSEVVVGGRCLLPCEVSQIKIKVISCWGNGVRLG
jgi:hypothetical protein